MPTFLPVLDSSKEENIPMNTPTVDGKANKLNPEIEYEVLELTALAPEALKSKLNELGSDGWMLVSAAPVFVFRRLKKSEDEKPKSRVGFSAY